MSVPTYRVLCVCLGNSDRSPLMAAALKKLLEGTDNDDVVCESAGVGESASRGGRAAPFAIAAAKRIGIDLSSHTRRHIVSLDLTSYDLIVCASDEIAGLIIAAGADLKKVYNAQITNPWPVQFEVDFERTVEAILGAMYRVVCRYFSD